MRHGIETSGDPSSSTDFDPPAESLRIGADREHDTLGVNRSGGDYPGPGSGHFDLHLCHLPEPDEAAGPWGVGQVSYRWVGDESPDVGPPSQPCQTPRNVPFA